MIYIRKSSERGIGQTDWLKSFHTFSFANYYDPNFMGFRSLRVINEDTVKPGYGFGKHPHNDMEIITYVIEGALEHKDSMGTGSIIKPGEIQRMSAGTHVEHSEFNHSKTESLHLLQIWIIPEKMGLPASYEQKTILKSENKLILIGSPQAGEGAVTIHQDAQLYVAYLTKEAAVDYEFKSGRGGWLQLVKGEISLNDKLMSAGDGAAITEVSEIHVKCEEDAELLLFDLGA